MPTSTPAVSSLSNPQFTETATPQNTSQSFPKWIPISVLAVTTAALALPLIYLRRQRNNALLNSLQTAPPRRTVVSPTRFSRVTSATGNGSGSFKASTSLPTKIETVNVNTGAGDDFNAALYTAKAFGLATLLVGAGAVMTVWGVKTVLNVQDTQEFAHRMRVGLLTKLPVLSARIHRAPEPELELYPSLSQPSPQDVNETELDWNWPEAERRMAEAYDKGGFGGWVQAALKEVEAEGRVERLRREKEMHSVAKTVEEVNGGKKLG